MSIQLRKKKLADGRVSLYLDIYTNGKREYEFLKLYLVKDTKANKETVALAEKIRAQRQLDLDSLEHGFSPSHRRKASFFEYFDTVSNTKTTPTRLVWQLTLSHMKKFGGDTVTFAQVNKKWLEEFKTYLLANVANNTASHLFGHVRTALRQAIRDEIITINPCDKVKGIKEEETHREYLTFAEVEKLAATPCRIPVVKRAFLFSCYTGLRYSDVNALRWRNIRDGRLQFTQEKTGGIEYFELAPQAVALLGEPAEADAAVFDLPSYDRINSAVKSWAKRAKIDKHVTFHVARHTFATLLLTHGVDLYTVSKLLGHKSIQMTQRYAKIIDQKKKDAVNALPSMTAYIV
jgi:integrase